MTTNLLLLPCAVYFRAGCLRAGIAALLLQLTLICWPMAVSRAKIFCRQAAVDDALKEYSKKYALPMHARWDGRRFRSA